MRKVFAVFALIIVFLIEASCFFIIGSKSTSNSKSKSNIKNINSNSNVVGHNKVSSISRRLAPISSTALGSTKSDKSSLITNRIGASVEASIRKTLTNININKNENGNGNGNEKDIKLMERPGLPFNLGCDEWKGNGFYGTVMTWDAVPHLYWLSSSKLKSEAPSSAEAVSSSSSKDWILLDQIQVYAVVSDQYDVPNMRLSVGVWSSIESPTKKRYSLNLDYIPREDILLSFDYYDRYLQGLDESMYNLTSSAVTSGDLIFQTQKDKHVVSRMVSSAFELSAYIVENREDLVIQLCESHLNMWNKWMIEATKMEDGAPKQGLLRERDAHLQRLHFEHYKFDMAAIMGVNFAPIAANIAAAMVGPTLPTTGS